MRPQPEASSFEQLAVTAANDGKIKIWVQDANEGEGIVFHLNIIGPLWYIEEDLILRGFLYLKKDIRIGLR